MRQGELHFTFHSSAMGKAPDAPTGCPSGQLEGKLWACVGLENSRGEEI